MNLLAYFHRGPYQEVRRSVITKTLRVMKLTALLLFVVALHLSAKTTSQSITLSGDKIKLEEVFKTIKLQTGYTCFYNDKILSYAKPVNIHAYNMPLEKFLEAIFGEQQGLKYTIKQTSIVVRREQSEDAPISEILERTVASEYVGRDIQGYVYDEKTAAPLRGITISVNGTNKATQSDDNGKFTLKGVADNFTVTVTSIGYEKRVIKVGKETAQLYIPLQIAVNDLDETIIQAYGTTSRRLATGNITKVSGDEIRRNPVMNPLLALQGRVPGLTITPISGHASSPVKVEIRGRNSINPDMVTEPLYVVDGIVQTVLELPNRPVAMQGVSSGSFQAGYTATGGQSPIFSINPADIESIEVLKDGDATAIYGSRAANGVILITTKKGKPGKTTIDLSVSNGVLVVPFVPEMLKTHEYLQVRRDAFKNDGITPNITNAPDLTLWDTTRYTDWAKELMKSGKRTDISAGISGGDINTSFRLSAGYTDQVDLNNRSGGNKRGTMRFNINHSSANKKFTIGLNGSYGTTKVDAISIKSSAFMSAPNAPAMYDLKGNLNYDGWRGGSRNNIFPFGDLLNTNENKSGSLIGKLSINYTLMQGLVLSANGQYTTSQANSSLFTRIAAQDPTRNPKGRASFGDTKSNNQSFETQLNYNRTIARGKLDMFIAGTIQRTITRGTVFTGSGYGNDDLLKSAANATAYLIGDEFSEYKYAAIFGRINYNWADKYIANFNLRRDGSSRFAPGKQYGNFGSVGVTWIASEEEWLKSTLPSWISFIKLRGSYGLTGSNPIGDYAYLARFANKEPSSSTPLYLYDGITPSVPIVPINQQYHWEALKSIDAGWHFGFMKQKINLGLTWYRNRASNQIRQLPTPIYTGFNNVIANWPATKQNQGVEASFSAQIIKKNDLRLSVDFNISRNWEILYAYPDIDKSPYENQYRVGQSTSLEYRLHFLGINPLTGDYVYEDYNKDGMIRENTSVLPGTKDDDRYVMIDLNPKFQGSFSPELIWKAFSLSMGFEFNQGKGEHPTLNIRAGGMNNVVLPDDFFDNYWKKPGDNTKYGRLATVSYNLNSDREIIDASYLRLKNISLTYALPEKLLKNAKIGSCDFSIQVQNIFTLSNYKIAPDIKGTAFHPQPRVIQGAISITL